MSIVNSIVMGKSRGKIGNVIFQCYKGITVARQKNDSISIPPTLAQIEQQNRMYNCGRSFSYLSAFLSFWKPRSTMNLSNAAYFSKNTAQLFLSFRALRGFQSVRELHGLRFGINRNLAIYDIQLLENLGVKTGVRVLFNWLPESWEDNVNLRILCQNITISGGTMPINSTLTFEHILTLEDTIAGYVDFTVEEFDNQYVVAYSDQYYTKSDGIAFSEIWP